MGGSTTRTLASGLSLLMLTSLLLAPHGAAQEPGAVQATTWLQADSPPEPLPPGGPAWTGNGTLTVQTNAPPAESFTVQLGPTDVPEHWNISVTPSEVTFNPAEEPETDDPQRFEAPIQIKIQAGPNATAYHTQAGTITPSTEETATMSAQDLSTDMVLVPGWRPGASLSVTSPEVEVSPNGETTTLTATLLNDGNGPARFEPAQMETPSGCDATPRTDADGEDDEDAWIIDAGETETIELSLDCGFSWDEGPVSMSATHTYALDSKLEGETIQAQWQLEQDGFGGWALIALLTLLAALLAGGTLAARDRENEEPWREWAQRKRFEITETARSRTDT